MIQVAVTRTQAIARDVLLIELSAPGGQSLPGAAPGAHVDVHLPNGQIRQYSLTNAQGQVTQSCYQIAVARDANSRGGSEWIHDKLRLGSSLKVSEPRNLFPLDVSAHKKILFIGAGIGITPIYSMVNSIKSTPADWTLMACARSASRLAFQEELSGLDKQRVHFHFDMNHGGPLDLQALLSSAPWDALYACGPAGLLDALQDATRDWPAGSVHVERFKAQAQDNSENSSFELVLSSNGQSVQVEPEESPLEALERIGVDHPFACREGLCGTCEVEVVEGLPDHRDNVLDANDRAAGKRFIPCVSRCGGNRLVINL